MSREVTPVMPRRIAIGRAVITLAAVAVVVVASIGYFSTTQAGRSASVEVTSSSTETAQSPTSSTSTSQPTTESYITTTYTVNASATGPQLPPGCAFVTKLTADNVSLNVYMSPAPRLGDTVCLYAAVTGTGQTDTIQFTITNSTGTVFLQEIVYPTGCCLGSVTAFWNTNVGYEGNIPVAGQYLLYVTPEPFDLRGEALGLYNFTAIDFTLL